MIGTFLGFKAYREAPNFGYIMLIDCSAFMVLTLADHIRHFRRKIDPLRIVGLVLCITGICLVVLSGSDHSSPRKNRYKKLLIENLFL